MRGPSPEPLPHAGEAVPSGFRWRRRFLLPFLLLVAAGGLLLLAGFHAVLRLPLQGGYGDVIRALRVLEERLPYLAALLLLAWALLVGGGAALLCILSLRRAAGPLCRMERVADDLASGGSVRPVRFREGDAGGELAESFNGFVAALRKDRDACLALLGEASREAERGEGCAGPVREALRGVSTVLSRYR